MRGFFYFYLPDMVRLAGERPSVGMHLCRPRFAAWLQDIWLFLASTRFGLHVAKRRVCLSDQIKQGCGSAVCDGCAGGEK
jgi:hypothetical protein